MKTYTVWYLTYEVQIGYTRIERIFVSSVPTYELALYGAKAEVA